MNIFIDTAGRGCNIALFDESGLIDKASEDIERGHAETLLPFYETLMHKVKKSSESIETIYVTIGPGSFTGLRVGLSVARFMAFSLQRPIYGITTFQAFSTGLDADEKRLVLIETKRSDYYCQMLDQKHKPIGEAQSMPLNDVDAIIADNPALIVTGDAVDRYVEESTHQNLNVLSQPMINIEKTISAINMSLFDLKAADAFYIRDADVSISKSMS